MNAKMHALALLICFTSDMIHNADANRKLRNINSKMDMMRTDFQRDIDIQDLSTELKLERYRTSELEKQLSANLLNGGGTAGTEGRIGVRDKQIVPELILPDTKVDTRSSFNIKLKDDVWKPSASGLAFLPDGQLVLCDKENYKIKLLSSAFKVEDSLVQHPWQRYPWDVSVVNATTVIVTLPEMKQLQYVHVLPRLQRSSLIQLDKDKKCYGIDVVGEEIYTSCFGNFKHNGEIRVLDMTGQLKRRFGVFDEESNSFMFRSPYYLTVSHTSGKIYVTDYKAGRVTCLSSDGDTLYHYKDADLNDMMGVYLDGADNIIVCGFWSSNLHIITANGKKNRTLLTSNDGIRDPLSVAYRISDNTLVVGSYYNDNLLAFKLVL